MVKMKLFDKFIIALDFFASGLCFTSVLEDITHNDAIATFVHTLAFIFCLYLGNKVLDWSE